ncbi:MAG: nicotinate phosphoribosyltransferase [Promethearchaeota archaeon]|nr:MAG: nicotinate phosphoribosyltransferase [Candidatus Lokiarchaeota archaeon]
MTIKSGYLNDLNMILATDFYQLTMGAAYYQENLDNMKKIDDDIAVFDLFVRRLPKNRNYMIFAGLEQVIHYLQNARFTEKTIEFLRTREDFKNIDTNFFDDYLPKFKFNLDVWAIKEGNFFFPNEPIMRVQGPMFHAQLAETYLLNVINYQTIVASKASRIKNIARDKVLLEFGTRRSHSPLAGVYAARASYIAGFNGTSNVIADYELGIKSSGTMAHSFVQKFENEEDAFDFYYKIYGKNSILLIDTYDTENGAKIACKHGNKIYGVRIDSGDLLEHSFAVRKILDDNGCKDVKIVASSDLNEYKIKYLLDNNAPIDAFGVGTELVTSRDDPALAAVYKLVEYQDEPRIKTSEEKLTYPGKKQIYRMYDNNGLFERDIMTLEKESVPPNSEAILHLILEKGNLSNNLPDLKEIQRYYLQNIEKLPDAYKALEKNVEFKIEISEGLSELRKMLGSGK